MPYGWCDTGGCSSFINSSLHIDPPIWTKDFELWFVSLKDFIPLLCCPVFVCVLVHWSLLTLFCFLNTGFLTAILPYRPASQSFHTMTLVLGLFFFFFFLFFFLEGGGFSQHRFSSATMFGVTSLSIMQASDSDEIIPCFWSTCPIFDLVWSYFLMSPNGLIMLRKTPSKSTFQKISGYTKVKVTQEDMYFV